MSAHEVFTACKETGIYSSHEAKVRNKELRKSNAQRVEVQDKGFWDNRYEEKRKVRLLRDRLA